MIEIKLSTQEVKDMREGQAKRLPAVEPGQEKHTEERTETHASDCIRGETHASDCISRQAAIDAIETIGFDFSDSDLSEVELEEVCEAIGEVRQTWLQRIKRVPSVEPEKRTEERTGTHACDCISTETHASDCTNRETHSCDCISRQAVLGEIADMYDEAKKWGNEAKDDEIKTKAVVCMSALIEIKLRLKALPSVEPERKPGKWIFTENHCWICSECGKNPLKGTGFTPTLDGMRIQWKFCNMCGAKMEV